MTPLVLALGLAAPPATAPPPRPVYGVPSCGGRVVGIESDAITLQFLQLSLGTPGVVEEDWTGTVVTHTGWPLDVWETWSHRGRRNAVRLVRGPGYFTETDWWGRTRTVRRADEPPRRFWVGAELEDGKFRPGGDPAYSYRLSDVRVGDEVVLKLESSRPYYTNLCARISIIGRPGGKVPPAPGERSGGDLLHHERVQAWQDWREKGTPIPERYGGPRYAELVERQRIARTAPPPRPGSPKPPAP